jgi:tripartite-type tricarboxylate transporter receptor subunit TctC
MIMTLSRDRRASGRYWVEVCKYACSVIAALAFSGAAAATGIAGSYPNRPPSIVVPAAAGQFADIVARTIARSLSKLVDQSILVQNFGRDGGIEAMKLAARAEADGYTLVLGGALTHVLAPLVVEVEYDPVQDFDPVTHVAVMPYVLATHVDMPANSISKLLALAKANPRALRYSSGGDPLGRVAMEMLRSSARLNIVHSFDLGTAPLEEVVHKAHAQVLFASSHAVLPHVVSGAVRAIAVSTMGRAAALPDVPTISESGYPGFEFTNWFAFFVPRATPAEIIHKWHVKLTHAARAEPVKQELGRHGAEPYTSLSNINVLQRMESESSKYTKLLSQASVKPGGRTKPAPGPAKF